MRERRRVPASQLSPCGVSCACCPGPKFKIIMASSMEPDAVTWEVLVDLAWWNELSARERDLFVRGVRAGLKASGVPGTSPSTAGEGGRDLGLSAFHSGFGFRVLLPAQVPEP